MNKVLYGQLGDQLNENMSAALVKAGTGMSLNDYAQQTTATDFTWPNIQDQRIKQLEAKLQELDMQHRVDMNTPFDETDDFRDYVVWLCGYTQRKTPPNQEEWDELRQETKKVAAKFALQTRTRRALKSRVADAYERAAYSTLAGQGISGSQALTGNEEMLTGCTPAASGIWKRGA